MRIYSPGIRGSYYNIPKAIIYLLERNYNNRGEVCFIYVFSPKVRCNLQSLKPATDRKCCISQHSQFEAGKTNYRQARVLASIVAKRHEKSYT